jgi:hypothetical protein
LLLEHPKLLQSANLDAAPLEGLYRGVTVGYWLASAPEGRQLLLEHPKLLQKANLDAAPLEGANTHRGVTVGWWLAATTEGRQLLLEHPQLLQNANLDAAPLEGPYNGKRVLDFLIESSEGRKLLFKHPDLLRNHDLNRGYAGLNLPGDMAERPKSLLEMIIDDSEGVKFLVDHPEFLKGALLGDSYLLKLFQKEYLPIFLQHGVILDTQLERAFYSNAVCDESKSIILKYKQVFELAKTKQFSDLVNLFQENEWLCHIVRAEDGHAVLHDAVLALNSETETAIQDCLNTQSAFFNRMAREKAVCNKEGLKPFELADFRNLRDALAVGLTALQSNLDKSLFAEDVFKLTKKFLTNQCILPAGKCITLCMPNQQDEFESIAYYGVEPVQTRLLELISQINSFCELDPDVLDNGSRARLNKLQAKITRSQTTKQSAFFLNRHFLSDEAIVCLEKLLTDLSQIIADHFKIVRKEELGSKRSARPHSEGPVYKRARMENQ